MMFFRFFQKEEQHYIDVDVDVVVVVVVACFRFEINQK